MPEFMLKRMILQNFPEGKVDPEVASSIDFMVQQVIIFNLHLIKYLSLNHLHKKNWHLD